jgi:hypothetical protein
MHTFVQVSESPVQVRGIVVVRYASCTFGRRLIPRHFDAAARAADPEALFHA